MEEVLLNRLYIVPIYILAQYCFSSPFCITSMLVVNDFSTSPELLLDFKFQKCNSFFLHNLFLSSNQLNIKYLI